MSKQLKHPVDNLNLKYGEYEEWEEPQETTLPERKSKRRHPMMRTKMDTIRSIGAKNSMMTSQPQKKSTKKKQINQPRDRANYTVDKEDADALKGKRPSYILGWNKVKYRGKLDA